MDMKYFVRSMKWGGDLYKKHFDGGKIRICNKLLLKLMMADLYEVKLRGIG